MKQQYILPNTYASEAEKIKAYKAVLKKETPWAKVIIKGKHNWRYYANTSLGTVFFEVSVKSMGEILFSDSELAYTLIDFIKL